MRRNEHPQVVRAQHVRIIEAAVRYFSPLLWTATRIVQQKWLRKALRAARGPLMALDLAPEVRAYDFEKAWLAAELEAAGIETSDTELMALLGRPMLEFERQIVAQTMWLPDDPRRRVIQEYTREILEDSASRYWQSITSPKQLAGRLVELRARGLSYVEMSNTVARQYGTEFYRAERLVRSSYNSATNYGHYQDLVLLYDRLTWLTAQDARVRRPTASNRFDHVSADGLITEVGIPFLVSGERLLFPGDSSQGASIGNIVNCRCTLVGNTAVSQPRIFQAPAPRVVQPVLPM